MRRALAPIGCFPSTFTATFVTEPPCSNAIGGVSLQPPETQTQGQRLKDQLPLNAP